MNLILSLAVGALLAVQDGGKERLEAGIKKQIGGVSGNYDLARTGIPWVKGLDAAMNKGKPILLFQLLGNFDDVFC